MTKKFSLSSPSCCLKVLKRRSDLLRRVRQYFYQQKVMEVETPVLSMTANVDVAIESFVSKFEPFSGGVEQYVYLRTSPEFHLKRLLAAGSGDIFSMGPVFRNGDFGLLHNPEFTMLEWYRIDRDHHQLMDDVTELICFVFPQYKEIERLSYGAVFERYLNFNPHKVSCEELALYFQQAIETNNLELSRNNMLDLLFSKFIEPQLTSHDLSVSGFFIYDYPSSMSALARKVWSVEEGVEVAARFELYINGVELANGYYELLDAKEQKERFDQDCKERERVSLPRYPQDYRLLAALEQGMPECAGVALGIDRLLMVLGGHDRLQHVISFDFGRA